MFKRILFYYWPGSLCFAVLAEDAIKAALADYCLKQEGEPGEKIAVSCN